MLSYGPQHLFAPPDREAVDAATAEIARRAGPRDVVLVYVSTHGAPGLLAREADGQEQDPAGIAEVAEWLAPLGSRPTVLVLSACFSGSFIPALRAENRIIFAAARADRTSFGCQAGAEHTVFGQAVLDALARPGRSLREVVGAGAGRGCRGGAAVAGEPAFGAAALGRGGRAHALRRAAVLNGHSGWMKIRREP